MTFTPPPPPPPIPGLQPKRSSPWVPILVVGTLVLVTLMAAVAAGIMIVVMRRGDATTSIPETPPVADAPPADPPPNAEPMPAAADPAPPEADRPARRASTAIGRRPRDPAARAGLASSPRRVGGSIAAPTKIRNVQPIYPQIAVAARVQGIVVIEATIDRGGRVTDTKVIRSIPLLDQAALDAVRQWEYTPTLVNGETVPVIMTVTVNFTLR